LSAQTYPEELGDDFVWHAQVIVFAIQPDEQAGLYPGVAQLQDDFDDNSIDTGKWDTNLGIGTAITETGQKLEISLPSASGRYASLSSDSTYDLRDRWAGVQLTNASQPGYNTIGGMYVADASDHGPGWLVSQNNIYAYYDNGTYTPVYSKSYSSVEFQYLRIREAGGFTYWEASTDGEAWTVYYGQSNTIDMSDVGVGLEANTNAAVAGSSTFTFDNFYLGTSDQTIGYNPSNYVVVQGGNSFGTHLTIGTLDNNNVSFLTGGQQVATFDGADGSLLLRNSSIVQQHLIFRTQAMCPYSVQIPLIIVST
jgi:hypothetical protein